jgi:hypothetical protein
MPSGCYPPGHARRQAPCGGSSTGPRPPQGLGNLTKPCTKHGDNRTAARAMHHYQRTMLIRSRTLLAATRLQADLPAASAGAERSGAPAPAWRPAQNVPCSDRRLPECEFTAQQAELSARRRGPEQPLPIPRSDAPFPSFRIGPFNREPAAKPAPTAPFKPFRTDPLNREPTAKPGSTAPFKPFRTDPLNREPTAEPAPTAPFKPFRTDPLNREPTAKPGPAAPFEPFRTEPLNREPAAMPGSAAPFKSSRICQTRSKTCPVATSKTAPLNRAPATKPGPTAPFKPFRTDPLNREPGTGRRTAAHPNDPDQGHHPA